MASPTECDLVLARLIRERRTEKEAPWTEENQVSTSSPGDAHRDLHLRESAISTLAERLDLSRNGMKKAKEDDQSSRGDGCTGASRTDV